ncbi:MAG: hypothetical protein QQN41_08220 [Nitrosopumilus sp.]
MKKLKYQSIPVIKYNSNTKPDHKYMRCEKSPEVILETGRDFVPVVATIINTRANAIRELKHLLKPRIYYFRVWGDQGIRIEARWESGISIDIYTEDETITKIRTKNIYTISQIQTHLDNYKSEVNCLCCAVTVLAKKDKHNKKLKGRLTKSECSKYLDELICEAEE